MSSRAEFEHLMEAWFADDAVAEPPAFLAGAIAHATRRRRPRRRWLATLSRAWAGDTTAPLGLTGRGLLILAASTLLAVALAAGALLAGSAPSRIASPVSPSWSFVLPPCDALTSVPGLLPDTHRPLAAPPDNGLLAVDLPDAVVLVDPADGSRVVSPIFAMDAGSPVHGGHVPAWSPDGRWLALRLSTGCGEVVLVAADGARAVGVPTAAAADALAWSPDGQWIATLSGGSVDVLRVGADGPVAESRHVWDGGGMFITWGPDGTLAVSDQHAIHLLRPGQEQPFEIVPGLGVMAPLAWSGDGTTMITAADSGHPASVYAISPVTGKTTSINGDAPVVGGKFLDIPLITWGNLAYFIGGGTIWSVAVDGADLRQVTADSSVEGRDWFTVSPDGRSIAFTHDGAVWLTDTDSGDTSHLLSGEAGQLGWQAIP